MFENYIIAQYSGDIVFFFFHLKEERFDKGLVRTTQIKSLLDLCCCARLLIKT